MVLIRSPVAIAALMFWTAASCSQQSSEPDARLAKINEIELPAELREASGLAAVDGNTVLTMGDEEATVYAVDVDRGTTARLFSIGDPVIEADFEGIAIVGRDVWLVTSDGVLYQAIDALGGSARPDSRVHSTGAGKRCEIEGLAWDGGEFLLACKRSLRRKERDTLLILAWSVAEPHTRVYLRHPLEDLVVTRKLNPSGLDIRGEHLWMVAARQHVLLEVDRKGVLTRMLPLVGHPQAEGIAVLPDGSIVIVDEGDKGGASLSHYQVIHGTS